MENPLDRRLDSFEDAVLPTNDTYFHFDGTNSDLARQLYLRSIAGGFAPKFTNFDVPDILQDRLDDLNLEWEELSGIAQRALLWDSGFAVTLANKPVQMWTISGHSMTDLAVPLEQFQDVGCVEMNCTQPDNTTSLSNLYCNGTQMLTAARCVVEDFDDPVNVHAAMWTTGGNPQVIPTPRVRKHDWKDAGTHFLVVGLHTVDVDNEPAYGECAEKDQNNGFGSLVLPCYTNANIPDEVKSTLETVEGTPWVSRWLVEEYASGAETSSTTSTKDGNDFDWMLLIPIGAGVVVVVGIIGLFVFFKRRCSKNKEEVLLDDNLDDPDNFLYHGARNSKPEEVDTARERSTAWTIEDTASTIHRGVDKTIQLNQKQDRESSAGSNSTLKTLLGSEFLAGKRVPYENLVFHSVLSKGANGEVWVGTLQSQQVAIKRLLQSKAPCADEVEEFSQEIELTASLVHPNIVSFLGVAWNSLNNLVMVLEFLPIGDLQSYLSKNYDLLTWAKGKIHIAVGIARALEYLHDRSPPLIHRDIKSKNILLTTALEAKLIDFGVSRNRQDFSMTAGVGTPYWAAPEILEGKRYTEQTDIYSFGVVLSELDTGTIPYRDVVSSDGKKPKPFQILSDVMEGVLRPSFSPDCPGRIRRIGVACCQHDPNRRPPASSIVTMLEGPD